MNGRNQEPIVTIGIPVYNGEKTIAKTLDSLLRQTYKKIERKLLITSCPDGFIKCVK